MTLGEPAPESPLGAGASERVAPRIAAWLAEQSDAMLALLERMARLESPSRDPGSQAAIFALLEQELDELGFRSRRLPGRASGGCLYAAPRGRRRGVPAQLLLGHVDTVWPVGTLESMPVLREDGRLRGPGVYDMRGGLVQGLFALRALRALELRPSLPPVVLLNSDEEIGSPESMHQVERLARRVARAYVLEPSLGPDGHLKTARKTVGRFSITVKGRAAHAGLDPDGGVSAILELSYLIQSLYTLADRERGVTVNVGWVDGGLDTNVIAPEARAKLELRVLHADDCARCDAALHNLAPRHPEARLEIEGGFRRPPLERTPGNQALMELARQAAGELGFPLEEATAGGASDGNTASAFTPTLDGLGAVGDGAHAPHEFVFTERLPERAALLALLLLAPDLPSASRSGA